MEIFFLYHEINNLEIQFWVENTLVASYSQAVIALKMCSKVTFSHRFDKNFWTVRNFWTRLEYFGKYTFGAWISTKILYFFEENRESYFRLNMAYHVTRNTDSNYLPMKGHKKGSLMIRSQIWLGNIFPISQDQRSRHQIFGKNDVGSQLYMSRNRFENVLKSDLRSPFSQKLLNGKEF